MSATMVAERELEVVRHGDGPRLPLVMLHEGLGSVALCRDFPARLAAATGREVIAWSRRGYGRSPAFAAPYGLDFMHREADAAVVLLARLGIARAHFFGHSDGGSIALLAAARHPARVASLMLEAPHVFVEPLTLASIEAIGARVAQDDTVARMGRYHADAPAVFRQWFAIWTDPAFAAWSIEADIAGVRAPTLLIQGEDDEYGTFAQLDRIRGQVPAAGELRLQACGHSAHRDQPDAVLDAARDFYGELN